MPQPVRLRATVEQIVDHANGLRSLVLKPERPVPRFRPGQFLQLALDAWDPSQHWPESRPFSVASPPESRDRLRITVSQVGSFTTRIMTTAVGDTVWLKLPYGEFLVESSESAPAVLVAGGTGVAAFVSFVTSTVAVEGAVQLLYGVRRPELLVYRDTLEQASVRQPRFRWQPFVEAGECEGATTGSLTVEAVLAAVQASGQPNSSVIYLAGPPAMISTFTTGLGAAGIAAERIRVDAWA